MEILLHAGRPMSPLIHRGRSIRRPQNRIDVCIRRPWFAHAQGELGGADIARI